MDGLLEAISNGGNEEEIFMAAERVENVNGTDSELPSDGTVRPLTAAVLSNNIAALKVLLSMGAKTEVFCTVPDDS